MYKNFPLILIGLLPLSLVSGPFIPEFLCIILSIYSFFEKKKINTKINLNINIKKIFIFFYVYLIFCSLISSKKLLTLDILAYIRYGIYAVSIAYFLNTRNNNEKILYAAFTFTLYVLVFDAYFQIFFGHNIIGLKPPVDDLKRISGFFGSKLILGSFLQKIFPFYLYILIKFRKEKIKLYDYFLILLISSVIFRSGDRSAIVLFLIYCSIFFFYFVNFRKIILKLLFIFIILISFLMLQNNSIIERNFIQTINQFKGKYYENFKKEDDQLFLFSLHHQAHYITAFRMFMEKPLFGHGPKTFKYLCKNFELQPIHSFDYYKKKSKPAGCSTHPHNIYLQLLAETGLVGFLVIFGLFVYISKLLIRDFFFNKRNLKNISIILLMGIWINLFPFTPTGNFFNNWLNVIYYFLIGFYLFEKKYI